MFEVTVKLGDRLVTKYRGQGQTTIGRDPGCELMLDNLGVSRRHAHLREVEGNFIIEDQNSTNGVFVNGHRISSAAQVQPGDEVRIGKFSISVRDAGEVRAREQTFDINRTIAMDGIARAEEERSQPKFVASVARDVFHKIDCNWIKATPSHYKVYFDSRDEATRAGKRPCRTCFPAAELGGHWRRTVRRDYDEGIHRLDPRERYSCKGLSPSSSRSWLLWRSASSCT